MSNKTTLQTNNTNLASYTDRVAAMINVANALPEAGSGENTGGGGSDGNVETCTGMIYTDAPVMENSEVIYTNENMQIVTTAADLMIGTTINVAKGTLLCITKWSGRSMCTGGATNLSFSQDTDTGEVLGIYKINDNFNLIYG